jgi:hypothetical protein
VDEGSVGQSTEVTPGSRPPLFVSDSRDDKQYLDEFWRFLGQYRSEFEVFVDEAGIEAGQRFDDVIQPDLERAKFGLLLVSGSFAASDYIRGRELPVLRRRRADLPWLLVRDCAWEPGP